ncbi:MAG TPA: hypothetical protein PLK37_09300 [Terricaulis sp.]|nr:hypothetical protein [Terricaulis sp.]
MILAYVRCSDGLEGDWLFDVLPRVGEDVVLRAQPSKIFYKVRKIEHYPTTRDSGQFTDNMDRGIALYLDPVSA